MRKNIPSTGCIISNAINGLVDSTPGIPCSILALFASFVIPPQLVNELFSLWGARVQAENPLMTRS